MVSSWRSKVRGKVFREPGADEVKRQFQVEVLLQACTNFLGRRRQAEAVGAFKKAAELDPKNRIIRAQLRVIEAG